MVLAWLFVKRGRISQVVGGIVRKDDEYKRRYVMKTGKWFVQRAEEDKSSPALKEEDGRDWSAMEGEEGENWLVIKEEEEEDDRCLPALKEIEGR